MNSNNAKESTWSNQNWQLLNCGGFHRIKSCQYREHCPTKEAAVAGKLFIVYQTSSYLEKWFVWKFYVLSLKGSRILLDRQMLYWLFVTGKYFLGWMSPISRNFSKTNFNFNGYAFSNLYWNSARSQRSCY